MNLQAFCSEYRRAIDQMGPWLGRAQAQTLDDRAAREDFGYALEQLLVRRDEALEEAESRQLVEFIRQIHELDTRLLDDAKSVREILGVDVTPFLIEGPAEALRA